MSRPADPYSSPRYLRDMPSGVLFGEAPGIEEWCRENHKERPTLLHLGLARRDRIARRKERRRDRSR